ncbi:GbsR/MarR family transcriptional regulator [Microbacterium sp. M1A1_1b]
MDASDDFVQRTASALTAAGFPRMPASVMMALMGADAEGLTADEIGARVGASPAAVSGAVRYLENVGLLRRRRRPGERRALHELTEHAWSAATGGRTDLYDHLLTLSAAELERLPEGSIVRERIAEMADFMEFARDALPRLLAEWRESRRR